MNKSIKENEKVINFLKYSKYFFAVSIAIFVIGAIFNIVNGTTLSVEFAGGALLKYSYVEEINEADLEEIIRTELDDDGVTFSHSNDMLANTDGKTAYTVTVQFSGTEYVPVALQDSLTKKLQEVYKDNNVKLSESSSVDASMGAKFLLKCITAIIIAGLFMILYVAFRFRRIGGMSAGVMAFLALLHDVGFVYVIYVIFQMPIDDNFMAVFLTILGYSLNDTIIIYDRVREERKAFGPKADIADVYNYSCTRVIKRTVFTSIATLLAIGTVYVVALIYQLDSVTAFAFPMMLGVICGCYSTVFIAGPLWVMWKKFSAKKIQAKKAQAVKKKPASKKA